MVVNETHLVLERGRMVKSFYLNVSWCVGVGRGAGLGEQAYGNWSSDLTFTQHCRSL